MSYLSRREFLKTAGISSSALLLPGLDALRDLNSADSSLPNIIILLFDAMSARNLSLYGYPRPTTPNLERFAHSANVYHAHYAGGNFTTSGTASLLTGTYPWTHRAINFRGQIQAGVVDNNIFTMLGSEYTRLAFPQNFWANLLLTQFDDQIERLMPSGSFSELNFLISSYFFNDRNMAARALDDFVFKLYGFGWGSGKSETLFLGSLESWLYAAKSKGLPSEGYPNRIPYVVDYPIHFRLDTLFNGLMSIFGDLQPPFFTYLHLLPPHEPYIPTNAFSNQFKDGLKFPEKPQHPLSNGFSRQEMNQSRRLYDEYIASTDAEFGRLLSFLRKSGVLDNSYLFVTSDHGEMFERGEIAHSTPLLHDPVVHIPLIVSAPGQQTRRDIYSPTSAVDILPTIARLTGRPIPAQTEGRALPGLMNATEDVERSIFVVEAKTNSAHRPLQHATIGLRQGNFKMVHYTGYDQEDHFELFDLENDMEELQDLYPDQPTFAKKMKDELLEALYASNKPYMK